MIGPTVGGILILGNTDDGGNKFSSMALPYMIVGSFVLLVAFLFIMTKLPEINEEEVEHHEAGVHRALAPGAGLRHLDRVRVPAHMVAFFIQGDFGVVAQQVCAAQSGDAGADDGDARTAGGIHAMRNLGIHKAGRPGPRARFTWRARRGT